MIVEVADLAAHLELDVPEGSDLESPLSALLSRVEATFLAACGRDQPFLPAASNVEEIHDGTGTGTLYTLRPVASLTQVELLAGGGAPTVYLPAALHVVAGSRLVRARESGVRFGALDAPGAVRVTYDAADDLPEDVQLAILRAAAALYLQRGAEDVRAESEGGVRSDFAHAFEDPTWQHAVARHREVSV